MSIDRSSPLLQGRMDPFDLWLKRSLHEKSDPVLSEEIPADLLRLACDCRSEWDEMKRLRAAPEERRQGSLS
jgi:hypothetical protein